MRKDRVTQGVDRIMQAIADKEFELGQAIPGEAKLAEFLDVSRPTMREVVRTLADRGVLEVVHGRGTFVAPLDQWSDVRSRVDFISRTLSPGEVGFHLTEVRRMIEVGSCGHAAARAEDSDLDRMQTALDAYDAALEAHDVAGIAKSDVEFHNAVFEATKNPVVTALMIPLEGSWRHRACGQAQYWRSPNVRKNIIAEFILQSRQVMKKEQRTRCARTWRRLLMICSGWWENINPFGGQHWPFASGKFVTIISCLRSVSPYLTL